MNVQCSTVNNYIIKFSDDTAILGLISGTSDVTNYKHGVVTGVINVFLALTQKNSGDDVWPQIHWWPLTSGH